MRKFDIPKPKARSCADTMEDDRIKQLDHFESVQMDTFMRAIGDELQMDANAAMSLIYHAATEGLKDWFCEPSESDIRWFEQWTILQPGWTPVEVAHWLAGHYRDIYQQTLADIVWIRPKRHKAVAARNAINFLARMLFYNDRANRFQGSVV